MTVELHQFAIRFALPSPSPFCLKLETWMRLAGIDYVNKPWSPAAAPQGKAPFVVIDGESIPDSSRIIRELTKRFDVQLDQALTPLQRAQALLVQRTLEEHTYIAMLHDRWMVDEVWKDYRWVVGQGMPGPIQRPMTAFLRRSVRIAGKGHGLLRHGAEEIALRGIEDVDAVMTVLGDQDFLCGATPTSVDATGYGFLAQVAHPSGRGALAEYCQGLPALLAYVERMRQRVWADWTPPS